MTNATDRVYIASLDEIVDGVEYKAYDSIGYSNSVVHTMTKDGDVLRSNGILPTQLFIQESLLMKPTVWFANPEDARKVRGF